MTGIIGVISDTHGLLRPEALVGHARLRAHHPRWRRRLGGCAVAAARHRASHSCEGNVDSEAWAMRLPRTATVKIGSHTVYVLHILEDLAIDPSARWHQRSRIRALAQAVDRGTQRRD